MDPVANLREQLELVAEILEIEDRSDENTGDVSRDYHEDLARAAFRLAELVQALDEWRRKGGFDPYTTTERT